MNDAKKKAIAHLLFHCGSLQKDDRALILCDPTTRSLADAFVSVAQENSCLLNLTEIPSLQNHGAEPPTYAASAMKSSTLILSICQFSLAHSSARREASETARFLSLPLYTWGLLEEPCVLTDFKLHAPLVKKVAQSFTDGDEINVSTSIGTDITLKINGRIGNYCPGFVENPGDLGSPPDIEANVSPIEDGSEGIVVIDGSITHPDLGLLQDPVELYISKGKITEFRSKNKKYLEKLNSLFGELSSPRRVLAECGIGLNPTAKLTGTMLTDEGALGCIHFGFGANHTVGGLNKVDFHLDFVFHAETLKVDNQTIIREGFPIL